MGRNSRIWQAKNRLVSQILPLQKPIYKILQGKKLEQFTINYKNLFRERKKYKKNN